MGFNGKVESFTGKNKVLISFPILKKKKKNGFDSMINEYDYDRCLLYMPEQYLHARDIPKLFAIFHIKQLRKTIDEYLTIFRQGCIFYIF